MNNPYFELIRTIWQHGKPWRHIIIGYYAAYIFAQIFLSLSPYAFGRTIDVLQHFTPGRLHEVIFWLIAGVIVWLLFWLFHGPARVKEREVALKIQQSVTIDLYEKLTHLPLKWHQNHHSGNIITRINRAAVALLRFAENQFIYIETIIKFFVSLAFLLWLSVPVGILSLITCVIAVSTVVLFDRVLIPLYDTENEINNHVGAVIFDYISNMTTVLTLRLGELTRSNLWQRMISMNPFWKKDCVVNEVKWFTMGMVLTTMQSIILIGYIVLGLKENGMILIGTVVMIFRYQWDLSDVFFNFSAHYSELVRMNTDVKSLRPILEDIDKLAHVPQGQALARQWHTIQIDNLEFHHQEENRHEILFDEISFSIKRGEKIALIGASGGGKSTLLNILVGLYLPEKAQLKIDGVAFNSLEPLQTIATLIPQDPEIFENTIEFNITLDLPTQEKEIERAIQLAGFTKVLATLPLGLKTDIREKGLNLSVGQKQRLALARGLFAARFSSLILMDEPTSSVDLPTEKEILSGVIDAFPDAALMVSLHRLHLLPKFDSIIMLSHGKIVAQGNAKELLAKPGPVRDLWQTYNE
jgi:ATP-binding cassette subfamily B protein